MSRRKRWLLGAMLLGAMVLLVAPAIVLAGSDTSSDQAKAGRASPAAEQLRAERRESFRHTGCSKRMGRSTDV
jgi:hypothetical protein